MLHKKSFLLPKKDFINSSCSSTDCKKCDDWNLNKIQFTHDEYPKDAPDYTKKWMDTIKIDFSNMISCCKTIHKKIFQYEWLRNDAERYAQRYCIKRDILNKILSDAYDKRPKKSIMLKNNMEYNIEFPYELLPYGMRQKMINLEDCIVGIMHTLVLNLGKHFLTTIQLLSSQTRIWSDKIYPDLKQNLSNIGSLSLNWCKALSLGSKDKPGSPWVSENYLAFMTAGKSILSIFNKYMIEKKDQNIRILIMKTITTLNIIIAHVFQLEVPNKITCNKVDTLTKLFLSYYNKLDDLIDKKESNVIETTACAINLLNIGNEMRKKGMQRKYWEGGILGEGFIPLVKCNLRRGAKLKGSITNAVRKIYQKNL